MLQQAMLVDFINEGRFTSNIRLHDLYLSRFDGSQSHAKSQPRHQGRFDSVLLHFSMEMFEGSY
jgi:hypothetical protein